MKTLIEIFNAKPEAKKKFEEWYFKHYYSTELPPISVFWNCSFPFQQGVVLEWLREQGIIIVLEPEEKNLGKFTVDMWLIKTDKLIWIDAEIYQQEPNPALLQAIEKAIELI